MFLFLNIFLFTIQSLHSMQLTESAHYKLANEIAASNPITAFAIDQYTGNILTGHTNNKIKIKKQNGKTILSINHKATGIDADEHNIIVYNSYPDNSIKIFDKETGKLKVNVPSSCFIKLAQVKLYRETGAIIALDLERESNSSVKVFNNDGKGIREFTVPFGSNNPHCFVADQNNDSIIYHYSKGPENHYMFITDQQGVPSEPMLLPSAMNSIASNNRGDIILKGGDKFYLYKRTGVLIEKIHSVFTPWNHVVDQANNTIVYASPDNNAHRIQLKVIDEKGNVQDALSFHDSNLSDDTPQGHIDLHQRTQNIITAIGSKQIRIFKRK